MTLLAYWTQDPGDICFCPRLQKVSLRGIKAVFHVQRVDYWDGES